VIVEVWVAWAKPQCDGLSATRIRRWGRCGQFVQARGEAGFTVSLAPTAEPQTRTLGFTDLGPNPHTTPGEMGSGFLPTTPAQVNEPASWPGRPPRGMSIASRPRQTSRVLSDKQPIWRPIATLIKPGRLQMPRRPVAGGKGRGSRHWENPWAPDELPAIGMRARRNKATVPPCLGSRRKWEAAHPR